eukprot:5342199-Prymnesium_polylepis.1
MLGKRCRTGRCVRTLHAHVHVQGDEARTIAHPRELSCWWRRAPAASSAQAARAQTPTGRRRSHPKGVEGIRRVPDALALAPVRVYHRRPRQQLVAFRVDQGAEQRCAAESSWQIDVPELGARQKGNL